MKTITRLYSAALVVAVLLSVGSVTAAPVSKKETIVVEGKLGMIKEERVQSVQSTISYVPVVGVASYDLIDISDSGANGFNEHVEAEELTIPSWTLFSW